VARKFLTPLRPPVLSSDPVGSEGDVYYNSVEKTLKLYDGWEWVAIGTPTQQQSFVAPLVSTYSQGNHTNGAITFNTSTNRLAVYYGSAWNELAYVSEIGQGGGSSFPSYIDGGFATTVAFADSLDGGASEEALGIPILSGGTA